MFRELNSINRTLHYIYVDGKISKHILLEKKKLSSILDLLPKKKYIEYKIIIYFLTLYLFICVKKHYIYLFIRFISDLPVEPVKL
jgi:hypothetical protein